MKTPLFRFGLLAVLIGSLFEGDASPILAAAAPPSSVKVTTSRGVFDMVVYTPGPPDPGPAGTAPAAPGPGTVRPAPEPLIFLASGEGGWRHFDEVICGFLADAGYWVGGMNVMSYFWQPQDDRPALAADVRAYVKALAAAAGRPDDAPVILAGYSFGADLAPWVAGAGGWEGRVDGLVMIGPDEIGSLAFRLTEILGFAAKDHVFPVSDALRSAAGIPAVFIHGEKDAGSAAPSLHAQAAEPKRLTVVAGANHHFVGKEEDLRNALIEGFRWIRERPGRNRE